LLFRGIVRSFSKWRTERSSGTIQVFRQAGSGMRALRADAPMRRVFLVAEPRPKTAVRKCEAKE